MFAKIVYFFYMCRHVILPKEISRMVPKGRLMTEAEWRGLGVQQSRGWMHYMVHDPGTEIKNGCNII